ncbi:MAG: hypothetical protein KGR16_03515 [Verrucomicrobia bacterium]|nr:hypothetical protein [Verrucomicrobiota bacterium]MDE3047946.1 hypothetical protein [Verrucomicrobiota bacterium]
MRATSGIGPAIVPAIVYDPCPPEPTSTSGDGTSQVGRITTHDPYLEGLSVLGNDTPQEPDPSGITLSAPGDYRFTRLIRNLQQQLAQTQSDLALQTYMCQNAWALSCQQQHELERSKTALADLQQQVLEAQRDRANLEQRCLVAQAIIGDLREQLVAAQSDRADLEQQLTQARRNATNQAETLESVRALYNQQQQELKGSEKAFARLQKEFFRTQDACTTLKEVAHKSSTECIAAERKAQNSRQIINDQAERLKRNERQIQHLNNKCETLRRELDQQLNQAKCDNATPVSRHAVPIPHPRTKIPATSTHQPNGQPSQNRPRASTPPARIGDSAQI